MSSKNVTSKVSALLTKYSIRSQSAEPQPQSPSQSESLFESQFHSQFSDSETEEKLLSKNKFKKFSSNNFRSRSSNDFRPNETKYRIQSKMNSIQKGKMRDFNFNKQNYQSNNGDDDDWEIKLESELGFESPKVRNKTSMESPENNKMNKDNNRIKSQSSQHSIVSSRNNIPSFEIIEFESDDDKKSIREYGNGQFKQTNPNSQLTDISNEITFDVSSNSKHKNLNVKNISNDETIEIEDEKSQNKLSIKKSDEIEIEFEEENAIFPFSTAQTPIPNAISTPGSHTFNSPPYNSVKIESNIKPLDFNSPKIDIISDGDEIEDEFESKPPIDKQTDEYDDEFEDENQLNFLEQQRNSLSHSASVHSTESKKQLIKNSKTQSDFSHPETETFCCCCHQNLKIRKNPNTFQTRDAETQTDFYLSIQSPNGFFDQYRMPKFSVFETIFPTLFTPNKEEDQSEVGERITDQLKNDWMNKKFQIQSPLVKDGSLNHLQSQINQSNSSSRKSSPQPYSNHPYESISNEFFSGEKNFKMQTDSLIYEPIANNTSCSSETGRKPESAEVQAEIDKLQTSINNLNDLKCATIDLSNLYPATFGKSHREILAQFRFQLNSILSKVEAAKQQCASNHELGIR